MADRIRVERLCDRHLRAEDVEVPADRYTLVVDRAARDVDLCKPCAEAYVTPLANMLTAFSRPARDEDGNAVTLTARKGPGRPRRDGTVPAARAVADDRAQGRAQAVQGELAVDEAAPSPVGPVSGPRELAVVTELVDEVGARAPVDCPLCTTRLTGWPSFGVHLGRQHDVGVAELYGLDCPVCGAETSALGGHTTRAHEGRTVAQAFLVAERDGDPHRVVARARARWSELGERAARAS